MAYQRLSQRDARSQERWRGVAFGRIQSGKYYGRVVSVVEFSETGCRLRDHEMACEVGDAFHLLLENVGPLVVDVRWRAGSFFGLNFRIALTQTVLDRLHDRLKQPLQQRMAELIA